MKKEHVKLSVEHREQLQELRQKSSLKARTYKRVRALLALDEGCTYEQAAEIVQMSGRTIARLAKRYRAEGLDCLYYRPRVGRPPETDQELVAKIVMLSCSEAPKGHSQWSLRLLADQAVVLGYCDKISHTQVAKILKKEN